MDNLEKWRELDKKLREIEAYNRCLGKLRFDMECTAPPEGLERAGDDMSLIGARLYELTHAGDYIALLTALHENGEGLSPVQQKAVEHLYDDYARVKNISAEQNFEMDSVGNRAYSDWLSAKKANDYALFRDSLAALIACTHKQIDLRDEKKDSYYNTCLSDMEKGLDSAQLDAFFSALREGIVPLLQRIRREGRPLREDFMSRRVEASRQEAVSRYLLELEGLRKTALVLATTEHPFTDNYGPQDVRVTTHYYEQRFISNVFTTMHEGGHALFMQNEPAELYENHCDNRMSNAMHETISRFYENLIGRSEAFLGFIAPKLKELAGGVFDDISARELYEAANAVHPGALRLEADELTYSLHIMIRYELEKAFLNGEITVDELPALWNAKYREYLGVEPKGDAEGCLQDVHWCGWAFGYFPSYALGNAYGAQILHTMEQDFDVFGAVAEGRLDRVLDWMRAHVFSVASLSTSDEWIRSITGESLNPAYYLDYLEKKYTKLYGLE